MGIVDTLTQCGFKKPLRPGEPRKPGLRLLAILASLLLFFLLQGTAAAAEVAHDLFVRLQPEKHLLVGRDTIEISGDAGSEISFRLSAEADIHEVRLNGAPASYRRQGERITLSLPAKAGGGPVTLGIEYRAVFDDPVPDAPANMDNPGFGVTGIVSPQGTFLQGGAGWYPRLECGEARLSITVEAPRGITAVTAGRAAGHGHEAGHTLSRWEVDRPVASLALAAGRFIRSQEAMDGVQVATYFLPQTQHLSAEYIEAAKGYLAMYADLFGPYPFAKFAVVENFFPTGYGFPSFTLLGGRVLRLPFILETSLGHEIAHCWWGNGVRVDPASGNWSEGLTTYVADHLYKEKESAKAAREYRRQWLRSYAALVDPADDFPLSEFASRKSPASKVIGYDKSAMFFHMLRTMLGEEAFWNGLRQVYAEKRFAEASWADFRRAFAEQAGEALPFDLERFFEEWITRDGAPLLSLQEVTRRETASGWRVSGRVVQRHGRPFPLPLTLEVETANGAHSRSIALQDKEHPFSMRLDARPMQAALDPGFDVFRRLHPEEIPASINAIKGAKQVSLVVAEGTGQAGRETARMLARSLGLSKVRVVEEGKLDSARRDSPCTVYIGRPEDAGMPVSAAQERVSLLADRFRIEGQVFAEPTDTFLGVFDDPGDKGRIVGLLYPVHARYGPLVARKATHYGKYSYLAFRKGRNRAKGVWPVSDSPLIVRWRD